MSLFLMELNNREIAILLWVVVSSSLLAWKSNVCQLAREVVRAFFQRKIILSLSLAAIWIFVCILALLQCGLWQWANFKTTLVWAVTFAFVTMFDVNRISEDDAYFGKSMRDVIGAMAIVAFVADSYSFSLPIELLLFPALVLVSAMQVVAERKPEYAQVEKLCYAILIITGMTYISYGSYQAVMNIGDFASWANFREFFIPILLSLLFLPFIYIFSVYVTYETNLARLNWWMNDKALRRYAKYQAIFCFRLDLDLLRRWVRDITVNQPSNRKGVQNSIVEVKSRKARERCSPKVPQNEGWCPYAAKDFAVSMGLATGDYHPTGDGQWFASSKLLELESDETCPDNLAYYIEGDERAAKRLKIKLNVNNPSNPTASESRFQDACEVLLHIAIGHLPANLRERITTAEVLNEVIGGRHILLKKDDFRGGISGGYSRVLTIELA